MKTFATTALLGSITASLVGLGIWFAPTHGQPNEDRAQLIDVTVVDDDGDPVIGAPIAVQRRNGTDWVGTPRGGASDSSGERSIEMPTGQGSYRIVLTVPQGYTEWYDDADGSNPGRNSECAGMVARCVAYDIDAAGTVTLGQPSRNSTGMAVTFHLKEIKTQPTMRVEQFDTSGNPVHGGTFTMRPYTIVTVDGQNVRQWGRESRTGMTTAGRTFRMQPFTSYIVRWEPPEGYRKVTPGAPLFGYEFTTGANGTSTKFTFTVAPTGAAGGESSGMSLDPDFNEISPPGVPVPTVPPDEPETPATTVPEDSSFETPDTGGEIDGHDDSSVTVSYDPTPVETMPVETVPVETVPVETVPVETVPEETVPEETVPEETVPEETVPEETVPEETVLDEEIVEEASETGGDPELEAELEVEVEAELEVEAGDESYEEWLEIESVEDPDARAELDRERADANA